MGCFYVLLLTCLHILILCTNGCLLDGSNVCYSGHPLLLGGRIQPFVRDRRLVNKEGRVFVFQYPPGTKRGGKLRGGRGLIRTDRKICHDSSGTQCPIPASEVPCGLAPVEPSGSFLARLHFSDITSSGVNVSWYDMEPAVRRYILRYRTVGDAAVNITVSRNETYKFVNNLEPDTEYKFQLVPDSDETFEDIQPAPPQSVRTQCGVPDNEPKLSLIDPTTPTQATLKIEIAGTMDGWKCHNISVRLQKRVGEIWEDYREINFANESVQLDDLAPCSETLFRIEMANTHHTVYSHETEVKTKGELGPVRNLQVNTSGTPGELYVQWEAPEPINNCRIKSYTVEYQAAERLACGRSSQTNGQSQQLDVSLNQNVMISDLLAYTLYRIQVYPILLRYSIEELAQERSTAKASMSTSPDTPTSPPRNITYRKEDDSSIKLKWEEVGCLRRNGEIEQYFYILTTGNEVVDEGETSEMQVTFTGLDSQTMYKFKIKARTSAGYGPFSQEVSFTTRG